MVRFPRFAISRYLLPVLPVLAVACTASRDPGAGASDTAAAAMASQTGGSAALDSTRASGMTGSMTAASGAMSAGATSADQEFLQLMSDHHEGLITIAHETLKHTGRLGVTDEARKLDSELDDQLARMHSALKGELNTPAYAPKAAPEFQAMADSLTHLSGAAYDRQFRQDVIDYHQTSIALIDRYLPRLTHADVKTMAERMRATDVQEMARTKQRLGGG